MLMKAIFILMLAALVTACATNVENRQDDERVQDYELIFDGFSPAEIFEFEDTLTRFSEYRSHRLIYSGERRVEYQYSMALSPDQLNNSLRAILGNLELKSLVRFSNENQFELKKVLRRKREPVQDEYNF